MVDPALTLQLANRALDNLQEMEDQLIGEFTIGGRSEGTIEDLKNDAKTIREALFVLQALAHTAPK